MRHPRLKPEMGSDSFMHLYNRTVGATGEYPFGPAEKEEFVRRLRKLAGFYTVEVLAFQVMGNHFHLLCHVPPDPPSNEEAAARYAAYHGGKRKLAPTAPACSALALQLRDVSAFAKDLQQPFTRWFNRTRPRRRRGHLWAERFKNTLLEDGMAVWQCWQYIEMNPVRAGLASSPADYRFCSFGQWSATGRHPFEAELLTCLMPRLRGLLQVETTEELHTELRKAFAHQTARDQRLNDQQTVAAIAVAAEKEHFSLRLDRRVRYWVDGLVIGSELFVREIISHARPDLDLAKRRFARALQPDPAPTAVPTLCCFKQLRVLIE